MCALLALGAPSAALASEHGLLASDGAPGDRLGTAVAISDGLAIVAAPDSAAAVGSAYAYRFDGASWVEEAELLAPDGAAGDAFGVSVAASGDVVLVGSWEDDDAGDASGSAHAFRYDGTSWVFEQKLVAPDADAGDRFGVTVAVGENLALIGTWGDADNGVNSGSAYVFRYDGAQWGLEQKLLASDGVAFDHFGISVALAGNVALVGAYGDDDSGAYAGAAYVYRYDGASWVEEQKLLASDGAANAFFGSAVAIDGPRALVGALGDAAQGIASGAAYVFRDDGGTWVEEAKLAASDGAALDSFGTSVALSDAAAWIGAPGHAALGAESGAAYSFRFDGAGWSQEEKRLSATGGPGERLGASAALSGDLALAGVPGEATNGAGAGAGRVFHLGPCGDGVLDPPEACDDGARTPGDGCSPGCRIEACSNGADDDGDGLVDAVGGDPGCWGAADRSERSGFLACDNGLDDDGDSFIDVPADPGCGTAAAATEAPECQDGIDNDMRPGTDFDGGESVLGVGNGDPLGADPHCASFSQDFEGRPCGLGFELVILVPWLARLRGSARRTRSRNR